MSGRNGIVPVYQTLSPWELLAVGRGDATSYFPFSDARGRWTFSGRVALHVGLQHLGLRSGSTILVPNYFQGVEIQTLLHNGFRLRFYRIDRSLRVCLDDAAACLDGSVSALFVIHYFGFPQDMRALGEFCRDHGLKLIEDCALSLFSRDASGWVGTHGDMAIFSLYKTLPLPHGGYLVSGSPSRDFDLRPPPWPATARQVTDLLQENLRARGWGRTERWFRRGLSLFGRRRRGGEGPAIASGGATWDPRLLQYGASASARRLLRGVRPERVIARRRRNYRRLGERLEGAAHTPFPDLPEGVCPLFFPVLVEDKIAAIKRLANAGVGSVNLWWEPHGACPTDLAAEVAYLRLHLLELPIHQSLSVADVDRVAAAFLAVRREA